ncbi:hypothetical protein E0I61_09105 [Flavobacterium ranwuense]|uniref:ATPase AAA-type core domain-containing protein n=1 Tax=Flavobacterium ranwuense TaxID=2541725 RepID=A0ABY2DRC2_9FLAO|nr:AAA family ATPase [Flavobacterium ranwuense]TDE29311.1 hypothetical protein E0I61_09105 [Flavobacterium ranwuense]
MKNENNFKLIAIRPLKNCNKRFLKNLKAGNIYKFYNDYTFLNIDKNEVIGFEEVFNIDHIQTIPEDLYHIKTADGKKIDVNISAIVGNNGSGKSSLLELLYSLCYVIATKKGIIEDVEKLNTYINNPKTDHNLLFNKINNLQGVLDDLQVEIFYEINNEFFAIKYEKQLIYHKIVTLESEYNEYFEDKFYLKNEVIKRKFRFIYDKLFFYTISINYSLYGLNTESDNDWLFDLFHKNDGYQTPLVINPFRKKGNIDVNSEYHLAQTRLMSNLMDNSFKVKGIVNGKKIDSILFELDFGKFNQLGALTIDNVIETFKKDYGMSDNNFITNVYNALYRNKEDRIKEINIQEVKHFDILSKYVFRKVFKIAMNYDEYKGFYEIPKEGKPIPKFRSFFEQILKLSDDRSHITLKLRQILNCIRFNTLNEDLLYKWKIKDDDYEKSVNKIKKHYFEIKTTDFIERIEKIKKSNPNFEISELIPASCFIPYLRIENSISNNSISDFKILSSGEQQFIHSIQSILYHIININSVFKSKNEKIKYNFLNIVLDEIELYFHPEFQRKFISELLEGIKSLNIKNINGINILFSTHSPFILSDIPHQNILKLCNGENLKFDSDYKTFGANIHDLLANDFFMKDGFMGEWAKKKIEEVIVFLNFKYFEKRIQTNGEESLTNFEIEEFNQLKNQIGHTEKSSIKIDFDYCNNFINLIGEPIIKYKLKSMMEDVYEVEFKEKTAKEKIFEIAKQAGLNINFN